MAFTRARTDHAVLPPKAHVVIVATGATMFVCVLVLLLTMPAIVAQDFAPRMDAEVSRP
ncbi:MAG: hypothetical protein ACU0DW_12390 [Shimia sp.]